MKNNLIIGIMLFCLTLVPLDQNQRIESNSVFGVRAGNGSKFPIRPAWVLFADAILAGILYSYRENKKYFSVVISDADVPVFMQQIIRAKGPSYALISIVEKGNFSGSVWRGEGKILVEYQNQEMFQALVDVHNVCMCFYVDPESGDPFFLPKNSGLFIPFAEQPDELTEANKIMGNRTLREYPGDEGVATSAFCSVPN